MGLLLPEKWSPSALHVLSAMVFWGQMQNYMMRQNLGILIVAMVKEGQGEEAGEEDAAEESCKSRVRRKFATFLLTFP